MEIGAKEKNEYAKYYLGAFLLPFLIIWGVFIAYGIHPFGSRQVLVTDLWHQYYPFLQELTQKLRNGESLMLTWNSGMGTNFISIIAYYGASPLNLLMALFPKSLLRDGVALLVAVKFGLCGLSFAYFGAHTFKRKDMSIVLFSLLFALCGFNLGYYWNIIWSDSVALLPLVMLGVNSLYRERRCALYVFSFALCVFCNYYIGYIVGLFTALYFISLCINEWSGVRDFLKKGFTMLFFTILACAMTLVVTYPALLALRHSYSAKSEFPTTWTVYQSAFPVLADLLPVHGATAKEGLPNIYCGLLSVIFALVYLKSPKIAIRRKVTFVAFLTLIMVSFNVNVLNYIWHGFHFTNMVPYRFAFTFAFLMIYVAYEGFTLIDEIDVWDITLCGVAITALVVMSDSTNKVWGVAGGVALAIIYLVLLDLYKNKKLDYKYLLYTLLVVTIAELCAQGALGVQSVMTTSYDTYIEGGAESDYFIDKYASGSDDFYRMERAQWKTLNDPVLYGYKGVSQFSSTANAGVTEFLRAIGVAAPAASNRHYYMQSTPLVNALCSLRYIVAMDGEWVDTPFETKVEEKETSAIYENSAYLPVGFAATDGVRTMALDGINTIDPQSPFKAQNTLFTALCGIDAPLYDESNDWSVECEGVRLEDNADGVYRFAFAKDLPTHSARFSQIVSEDGMYYLYQSVPDADSIEVDTKSTQAKKHAHIMPLGEKKAGEEIVVTAKFTDDAKKKMTLCLARIDEQCFWRGMAIMADEGVDVTKCDSNSIEGTLTLKEDAPLIFSIPYDEGWSLYVDGEKCPLYAVDNALLCADAKKGEHSIRLSYVTPGIIKGGAVSLIALLITIIIIIKWRKKSWT